MSLAPVSASSLDAGIISVVKRYWGYDTLRPLQAEAIRAGIEHRDSLVVLPTGGGKSLCYQVPPMAASTEVPGSEFRVPNGGDVMSVPRNSEPGTRNSLRTDIVVSPLISLMKDQVDGLVANGYPAAALHSGITDAEKRDIERGIAESPPRYRLLFVAPERLLTPYFLQVIRKLDVRAFAIDEAHCISQWGHDFRPEYRQLARLKSMFPGASVHAYTATATPRVRQDIIDQLKLVDPNVLVGVFDRPNLIYRIVPKVDLDAQVIETIRRHKGEAAIVYCISRKDTESMAAMLKINGINAAHYHAGMEKGPRSKVQEAFAEEQLDVVVATVAFGMGIDRSNVRCVIHAAMPKTVEHYQQETGRAGRDGLEAECIMFYSQADVMKWERLIEFSAEKIEDEQLRQSTIDAQSELLSHMQKLCGSVRCRHGALSRYFGQDYENPNCGACDICLDEFEGMRDSTVVAQKILSCVARLQQRFGIGHIVEVLTGANTAQVKSFGHDEQSTYGLLREMEPKAVRNLVFQLIDQGVLERTPGDRPIVHLNDASIAVLKGQREVRLIEPQTAKLKKTKLEEVSWENVDRGLFEHLRQVRKQLAAERNVPAFVILGDQTLRELATVRPTTLAGFRGIRGIGEQKLADLGEMFVREIADYCAANAVATDQTPTAPVRGESYKKAKAPNATKELAMQMIAAGKSADEIARETGRAPSTVGGYIEEWVRSSKPKSVKRWVDDATYERVKQAAIGLESRSMKPIFDSLNGEVPYESIRIVVAHIESGA